jgi:organic hydroperoxide reductase OsmC/OhrA
MAHQYEVSVTWTGDRGTGTSGYRDYGREHEVTADGPAALAGSSDPVFRGDRTRWNPEQLLVAAASQCHMLWYLHLCADAGVVVVAYVDDAVGSMDGTRFTEVVLRPRVTVTSADMVAAASALHADAHTRCYIANSVNFPIRHSPTVEVAA